MSKFAKVNDIIRGLSFILILIEALPLQSMAKVSQSVGPACQSAPYDPTFNNGCFESPPSFKLQRLIKLGQDRLISSMFISPDKTHFAIVKNDKTVLIVNSTTNETRVIKDWGPVMSLAFSPDGKSVAIVSNDGTVKIVNLASNEERVIKDWGPVMSLAFSPDGKSVAIELRDGTVKIINLLSNEEKVINHHGRAVTSMAFSPDGMSVAIGFVNGPVKIINIVSKEEKVLTYLERVMSVTFSPDGKSVMSTTYDGPLKIVNLVNNKKTMIDHQRQMVTSAAFSPDSKSVVSASFTGIFKVVNLASNKETLLNHHVENVYFVAFFPDDKSIAIGHNGKMSVLGFVAPTRACLDERALSSEKLELIKSGLVAHCTPDSLFLNSPPNTMDDSLLQYYSNLRIAKTRPSALSAEALNLSPVPFGYYRNILTASRQNKKFKATPVQVMAVLDALLKNPSAKIEDYELVARLITESRIPIDLTLFNKFSFDPNSLRKDINELLVNDPLKYASTTPTMTAIKLIHAFLSYPKEEVSCSAQTKDSVGIVSMKNQQAANILTWFGTYWNSAAVDKEFFGALTKLVLEERPDLCEADRRLLQNAFLESKTNTTTSHQDLMCVAAMAQSHPKNLGDLIFVAKAVGLNSDLTFESWKEQLKAREDLKDTILLKELDFGIWRYILGNPDGYIMEESEGKKIRFNIKGAKSRPGSLLQLCRVLNSKKGELAKPELSEDDFKKLAITKEEYTREREKNKNEVEIIERSLQGLKKDLQTRKMREWPQDFKDAEGRAIVSRPLVEEMSGPQFKNDLEALESDCQKIANTTSQLRPIPSLGKTIPSATDFSPGKRRRKVP